jgi:hypothetical protein
MQTLRCMRQQIAVLVDGQRWTATPSHTAAIAFSSPGAPSTMRNCGRRSKISMCSASLHRRHGQRPAGLELPFGAPVPGVKPGILS